MIKLTSDRNGEKVVYINPRYIKRVSVAQSGATVIEVEGSEYSSWVKETPEEVWKAIKKLDK